MENSYVETYKTYVILALLAGGSFKTVHAHLRIAGRLSQHLHKLKIQGQDLQHS
ncbi:phage integrase N-terminal domain-containing protein [Cronobacter dublinensis]|uniref:phage integrase N-terminal domain-containing protein n=1 Tax=Cronobacter dublinensis TaxID=413497 RepID=UPI003D32971D